MTFLFGMYPIDIYVSLLKIGRRYLPCEGNEMMFTEGEDFNVLHYDHFIMVFIEHCSIHDFFVRSYPQRRHTLQTLFIPLSEVQHRLSIPFRRPLQPLPIRILPKTLQQLPNSITYPSMSFQLILLICLQPILRSNRYNQLPSTCDELQGQLNPSRSTGIL